MKRLEHKIKWALVTKFLKVTKSTPQQLLDWLEWGFKNVNKDEFICHKEMYIEGKYFIAESRHSGNDFKMSREEHGIIDVPVLITSLSEYETHIAYPARIWRKLQCDEEFRKEMIDKFKKHYKLK